MRTVKVIAMGPIHIALVTSHNETKEHKRLQIRCFGLQHSWGVYTCTQLWCLKQQVHGKKKPSSGARLFLLRVCPNYADTMEYHRWTHLWCVSCTKYTPHSRLPYGERISTVCACTAHYFASTELAQAGNSYINMLKIEFGAPDWVKRSKCTCFNLTQLGWFTFKSFKWSWTKFETNRISINVQVSCYRGNHMRYNGPYFTWINKHGYYSNSNISKKMSKYELIAKQTV